MQSLAKTSTLLLVVLFSVAANGSHRHDCFGCTSDKETLKNCTEKMMGKYEPSGDRLMGNRSLSPWIYEPDTRENRVPPVIWTARCGGSDGCGRGHSSEPIMVRILVLMREKCDDGQSLRLKMQPQEIPVGCTCVRHGARQLSRGCPQFSDFPAQTCLP